MQTFVVLGLIPGTNIQINLNGYLVFVTCLFTPFLAWYLKQTYQMHLMVKSYQIRKEFPAQTIHQRLKY